MSETFKLRHVFTELVDEIMDRVILPRTTATMYAAGILGEMIILLRGGTGTGKSTLAKLTSDFFGASCEFNPGAYGNIEIGGGDSNRVQCTYGTQSRSFLGGPDIGKMAMGITKVVFKKFITKPIRLLDEGGRLNPYVWADFAQLLAEYELDIEGETLKLPRKGVFIFTMNPPNPMDPANNELPPFILSRVNMKLSLASTTVSANRKIAKKDTTRVPMPKRYTQRDLESAQDEFRAMVSLSTEANVAVSAMVRATSYCKKGGEFSDKNEVLEAGMFPICCANCDVAKGNIPCSQTNPLDSRTIEAASDLACALAYFDNRTEATVNDIVAAFSVVTEHRLNFYNAQYTSKTTHVKAFVNDLLSAASDCINLAKKAETGRITTKELEVFRNAGNPLVIELIPDFEEIIRNAAKKAREGLGAMNSRQLQDAKGNLSKGDADLVDKMIASRLRVEVEVHDKKLVDQAAFRNLFKTPEGELLVDSDAAWDELLAEGFANTANTLAGMNIEYFAAAKKVLILNFTDSVYADEFRTSFATKVGAMNASVLHPYAGISGELAKAGIVIAQKEVATPPAVTTKATAKAETKAEQTALF